MKTRTKVVIACCALALAYAGAMVGVARAQVGEHGYGHGQMHQTYQHWQQPDNGASCCNDKDCRPTRARMTDNETWEAWNGHRWIPIPPAKVLHIPSPDGRSHLCSSEADDTVWCFLPGEVKG